MYYTSHVYSREEMWRCPLVIWWFLEKPFVINYLRIDPIDFHYHATAFNEGSIFSYFAGKINSCLGLLFKQTHVGHVHLHLNGFRSRRFYSLQNFSVSYLHKSKWTVNDLKAV